MRIVISSLLVLCLVFYRWLDQAPSSQSLAASPGALAPTWSPLDPEGRIISHWKDAALPPTPGESSLALRLLSKPGGEPVHHARVVLAAYEGQTLAAELSTQSAADGLCTFEQLQPGTYAYRILQPESNLEWCGQVQLEEGSLLCKNVHLSELALVQ